MRKAIGLVSILLLATGPAWAQSVKDLRLGELARRVRAERAQRNLSNIPYFTNDNLPRAGAISIIGGAVTQAQAEGSEGAPAGETTAAGEEPECGEDCWRAKFREKREQIRTAERELTILEREYQLARTQYYQDPNQAMREQYSGTTGGGRQLQKLLEDIQKKKQEIQTLQRELTQLENELRRSGGKPGWARPE